MVINNIVVYSVDKRQHDTTTSISEGSELSIENTQVIALLDGISNVYIQKTGKGYAKLDEQKAFAGGLNLLYEKENDFITFTNNAMENFEDLIAGQALATGGYLLFYNFKIDTVRYFMIVMLKSREGYTFNEDLELMAADQLDLDKLHFAARVNVNLWLEGESEKNYVSFN